MVFADGTAVGARLQVATMGFASHVVRGRWFMFFASILIMAAAGCTYIFGIYSKEIKTSLGYDQHTLNMLSLVGYLMIYLSITGRTVLACGVGGTLTAVDNMGQIGQSLGYPQRSISTLVSLVSIWNYDGRVVAGFASEHVLSRYKVPRPLVLTAVLLVACSGHLLIALGVNNGLYPASVILGFCFGPVGSYILNVGIAGRKYYEEALRQGGRRGKDLTYTSQGPRSYSLLWFLLLLLCSVQARAYDPLDPRGNITINWDFLDIKDTYSVSVSLQNNQLYRHLEDPGWRLSWFWAGDEVILEVTGVEGTEQGNCTRSVGAQSCEKQPVMVDLGPGTPYNRQVANCCRGGVLSSLTQNSKAATSTFMMTVSNFAPSSDGSPQMPFNFSIGVPGYTCSNATVVPPTRTQTGRQRHIQALNDTELFWGLPNFNKMLLQDGNVQMEILLRKDEDFTFDAGWAFPRKIYFDGGECAMPSPENYPQMPSGSCDQRLSAILRLLIAGSVLVLLF